ncbi:hypothetical protein AAXE64_28025 [Priestia megaterium]
MKTINELIDGQCIVVAKHGDSIKHFDAVYVEPLGVVYFVIPDYYDVIGYIQEGEEV